MLNASGIGANMAANIMAPRGIKPRFLVRSLWDVEHYRRGALIGRDVSLNLCTAEGLNLLLNVMFGSASKITNWYIGLFEDDYVPLDTDTYAAPGCTETTAYTEATRPLFENAAAAGKLTSNTLNRATFSLNASKQIYGGILVGGGAAPTTKADKAGGGTLYASCRFNSAKWVENGDVLLVTVSLTAADIP